RSREPGGSHLLRAGQVAERRVTPGRGRELANGKQKEAARAPPPSQEGEAPHHCRVPRFVKLRIEAFGDKPTTEQITSTSGSFVHAFAGAAVSLRRSHFLLSNGHATRASDIEPGEACLGNRGCGAGFAAKDRKFNDTRAAVAAFLDPDWKRFRWGK